MHSHDKHRVERRLAAILAADVTGYSRLMGADEEGTLARMKALRHDVIDPAIADCRGRLVKTTGDGMLVEFPSVVEATRCAIAMQRELIERNAPLPPGQRIEFRIGINVGDIIIDGDDIHGDGVNVAARLEGLAEPRGICVSAAVRDQVFDKLSLDFEDMGDREVKNIARPVHAYRLAGDGQASVKRPPPRPVGSAIRGRLRWRRLQIGMIVLVLIVAIGLSIFWQSLSKRAADGISAAAPASIAVLPFTNLSDDPQQDFFSDGLTDGILTSLTRFRELFVIARNSTFTFKDKAVDVAEVGRTLGARYVLEGSVQKVGERVRVTAQLIDAETAGHLWADRYDRPLADVLAVQDEITERIATTLVRSIERDTVAAMKHKPLESLTAYDLYLRGREQIRTGRKEDMFEGEKLFQRALEVDPEFAPAHAGFAYVQYSVVSLRWDPERREERLEKGLLHAKRAIELDPALPLANQDMGNLNIRMHNYDEAVAWGEKAVRLNPSDAETLATLANIYTFVGRAVDAVPLIERAHRLDPFHPPRYDLYLARVYLFTGRYEEALPPLHACMERAPERFDCPLYLAAALGQLGRIAEARQALAVGQKFLRRPSVGEVNVYGDYRDGPELQRYLDGLRKAGLSDD
jgi:adenylate cyclase